MGIFSNAVVSLDTKPRNTGGASSSDPSQHSYPEAIVWRGVGSQRKGAAKHHTSQYPYIDLQSLFLALIYIPTYQVIVPYIYSMRSQVWISIR